MAWKGFATLNHLTHWDNISRVSWRSTIDQCSLNLPKLSFENVCDCWCMHQWNRVFYLGGRCATVSTSTELGGRCATQGKSTELCSRSAAVVPQSKPTAMWNSAAVVPQSKSTGVWSSAAPFHHDLWYFRHRKNEHFSSMLFIWKKLINQPTVEQHSSHWNQHYTRPNYWKSYWREHSHSTEGFDDSLETCERCSVSEPVFKHNSLCSSVHDKKCDLGSLISTQVKKTCQ